jgi:transforming growth factor-beta-induced protein
MRNMNARLLAALATTVLLAACGGSDDDSAPATPGTLAQVAIDDGYTALVAAAQKAGLADALSDPAADLTVFAPTNAAFDSLATTLGFADAGAMVNALDAATLGKVLSYHVLPTRQDAAALAAGGDTQATLYTFPAATQATVGVDTSSGVALTDAVLTRATVTAANVAASNGVLHGIDKVMVPPGVFNLVQMAQLNPAFSVLVEAVVTANLAGALSGAGPLTVFAPTDDAFVAALGELGVSKDQLLASPNLASILTYHVVMGDVRAADVAAAPKPFVVPTLLSGASFSVDTMLDITDGQGRVAKLVATDVIASNGVIHVIDKVLLP